MCVDQQPCAQALSEPRLEAFDQHAGMPHLDGASSGVVSSELSAAVLNTQYAHCAGTLNTSLDNPYVARSQRRLDSHSKQGRGADPRGNFARLELSISALGTVSSGV